MKIAVRYYTKTGNTKKLAEAVAEAVGVEALPISEPVREPVDVLFLGNSYYAFNIDPEVRSFIQSLDRNTVGRIVNFGSAAMLNSTYKKSRRKRIRSAFRWTRGNSTAAANSRGCIRADRTRRTCRRRPGLRRPC